MTDKKSLRIDKQAHSLAQKISLDRYGSERKLSAVMCDAVRFVFDPSPEQRALRIHYSDDNVGQNVYSDEGSTKVVHWTAPSDLVKTFEENITQSESDTLGDCIYRYAHAIENSKGVFTDPSKSEKGDGIDWDAIKGNYQIEEFDFQEIEDTKIKNSYKYRLPLVVCFIKNNFGSELTEAGYYNGVKTAFYDKYTDVSEQTIQNDFDKLLENKIFIEGVGEMSNNHIIDTRETQTDGYVLRSDIDDYVERINSVLNYISDVINNKEEIQKSSAKFTQAQNTLRAIQSYDIEELEGQSERAEQLHKDLVSKTKVFN